MALSNDDIKQLIAILQKGLANDTVVEETITEIENKPTSAMKTKSVKVNKELNNNRFLDMGVKDLHRDDIEIDKALKKFPPTPRTRQFKPIDVVCRSCGKKESVSPALLHDSAERYKCNKCSGSAG